MLHKCYVGVAFVYQILWFESKGPIIIIHQRYDYLFGLHYISSARFGTILCNICYRKLYIFEEESVRQFRLSDKHFLLAHSTHVYVALNFPPRKQFNVLFYFRSDLQYKQIMAPFKDNKIVSTFVPKILVEEKY